MAFGISFVDIELLIRLAQNQTAESEPVSLPADAADLPPAIIPVLSETPSISDSFLTKNSETNIFAAAAENLPSVSLNANSGAAKNPSEENDKVADIVFNLAPPADASSARRSPPASLPPTSKQTQTDAEEIIFRSLLEKFRMSVVYDYETSDALQLEEDAARKQKPLENFSRAADSSRNRADRKKEIQDKENLRRESLRNETQSAADRKRELLKKIEAANKFL